MKCSYNINSISFYGIDWICSCSPQSKPKFGRIIVEAMRQISYLRYKILHLNFPEASSDTIWSVLPTWHRYDVDKSAISIGALPDFEAITGTPTYDQYLYDLRSGILQLLGYSRNPLFSKGFIRVGTENAEIPIRYSFSLLYRDAFGKAQASWCRNNITCSNMLVIDIEEILKFLDILNYATPVTTQNILVIDDQEDVTMDTHIHRTWAHGLNSNITAVAHSGSYTYVGVNSSLTGSNFAESSSRNCINHCCTWWQLYSLACSACREVKATSNIDYIITYTTPVLLWDEHLGWSIDANADLMHVQSNLLLRGRRNHPINSDNIESAIYQDLHTNVHTSVTATYKILTKNNNWVDDWRSEMYKTKKDENEEYTKNLDFVAGDQFSLKDITLNKIQERGYYDPSQNDYVHDVSRIYVTQLTIHSSSSSYAKACLDVHYMAAHPYDTVCTHACATSRTSFHLPRRFPT